MKPGRDNATRRPPWWFAGHAIVVTSLMLAAAIAYYDASSALWIGLSLIAGGGAALLQWKLGKVDASTGRGHALLSAQRMLAVGISLGALATLNPVFSSLFVALPLATARFSFPGTRQVWVSLAAASSMLLLGTDLPLLTVLAIALTSGVIAVAALRTTPERILTAYLPEDSLRMRRPILAFDANADSLEHSGEQATTDNLHQLVSVVRAASRARFAGIFWLDAAHEKFTAAIVETAHSLGIFERSLPLATAFADVDVLASPIQQFICTTPPAWYLEAAYPDAQVMVAQIVDDGITLGLLIVERSPQAGAFQHADFVVAEHTTQLVAHQLRQERVALSAARNSHDLRLVARAAELLSDTLSESEVYRLGDALFQELLGEVDVAFFHKVDEHAIEVSYVSEGWTGLKAGQKLPQSPNLVSVAIQRRHVLPYRSEGESDDPPLFGLKQDKLDVAKHLICPLVSGREAHSAVVVRVPQAGVFPSSVRERLQLVSNQLAAALGIARAYETMVVRATTDGMTQLLNHMTFRDQSNLAVERAQRSKRPLSVLLLDIDHFKAVNDTYGHAVGDAVIQAVAEAIRAQVRRVDIAARYGGEEFAIVLEDTGEEGALLFAERLRASVEALTHHSEQGPFGITISVGISVCPEHGFDADELTENADAALYVSKRSGRNRVSVWSSQPNLKEQVA